MLHPDQFQVNEAWIAFRLNDAPIHTESDGDFNCVALMDAASCFILTSAFVPTNEAEPSRTEARRLLKEGRSHKQELPKTLFVPSGQPANNLTLEAEGQRVTVVCVPEDQLFLFIGEAREAFKEHFGGGSMLNGRGHG
ncbi:MAG: hypothetical protein ACREXW_04965 [Gammaproteobacteria bacterium]